MTLDKIQSVISSIREGRMVVVMDEQGNSVEGHLLMAAEKVTPQAVNFMAAHARGLVCLPMTAKQLDRLRIPLMSSKNRSPQATAFCVSVEARRDVTTGISAADRATTILTVIDPRCTAADIVMPGHVFPLRACPGGVLQRAGQTEAAVDLARISGLTPAGVSCEIMNDEGGLADAAELEGFVARHGLPMVSVAELIHFRLATEKFVEKISSTPFRCFYGQFELHVYENRLDGKRHLALVKGEVGPKRAVLVRMHAESVLSDVFLAEGNPRGRELRSSLSMIEREGEGVLVYLTMRDREQALLDEVRQRAGEGDEAPAQSAFREFGVGAQILVDLGLREIRLLTNHPKIIGALAGFDLKIVDQIPIPEEIPTSRVSGSPR